MLHATFVFRVHMNLPLPNPLPSARKATATFCKGAWNVAMSACIHEKCEELMHGMCSARFCHSAIK